MDEHLLPVAAIVNFIPEKFPLGLVMPPRLFVVLHIQTGPCLFTTYNKVLMEVTNLLVSVMEHLYHCSRKGTSCVLSKLVDFQ